jgi:hypothetical protein
MGETTVIYAAEDAAGFTQIARFTVTIEDNTAPTASIAALTGPTGGTYSAVITLSETSTDFDLSDLTLTNATATLSGSGTSYSAVLSPIADGPIALSVDAGKFSDAAGNLNAVASNEVATTFDGTAPTASIAAFTGPTNGDQAAVITLSEASTDFGVSDLTLTNATATLSGSGTRYTAVLTPVADGEVRISIAAGTFTDAAGNINTSASNEVIATFDGTAPTVTLSAIVTSVKSGDLFDASISFSEPVTGFSVADVLVNQGTVVALTGSGANYVATVRVSGGGDVEISIPAGAVMDAASNGNTASDTLRIASGTVTETQLVIANFQLSRANHLLSNQPDLTGFLSGTAGGAFSASVTRGAGNLYFANNPNQPIWIRLAGSWSQEGTRDTAYAFGAIGSHFKVNPNLLIGGMVEFDLLDQDEGISHVDGRGWLAGPYFVARVPKHELYFEGRLLYGQSTNNITPFGTYTDSFDTERILALIKVSGALNYGDTRLIPSLQASYTSDNQKSYIDSLANVIPEQKIELAQINLGIKFETPAPFYHGDGTMTLTGGTSGIWSHTNGSGNAATVVPAYEGGRMRIDLGLNYVMPSGGRLSIDTFYDGIGASGYRSYGAQIGFDLAF